MLKWKKMVKNYNFDQNYTLKEIGKIIWTFVLKSRRKFGIYYALSDSGFKDRKNCSQTTLFTRGRSFWKNLGLTVIFSVAKMQSWPAALINRRQRIMIQDSLQIFRQIGCVSHNQIFAFSRHV